MTNKAYFQYYETFETIVQKFSTEEEKNSFRSKIIEYGLFGKEPEELTPAEDFVWDVVQEMIDDQKHRREVNRANRTKKTEPAPAEPKVEDHDADAIRYAQEAQPKEEKPKVKKFVKPTAAEVQNYCNERNNGINGQQFIDYYEARGWKIGNSTMKDWKAAVRTWEQRRTPSYQRMEVWPEEKLML